MHGAQRLIVAVSPHALDLGGEAEPNLQLVYIEDIEDATAWMSSPALAAWLVSCDFDDDTLSDFATRAERSQPNVPLVLLESQARAHGAVESLSADLVLVPGSTAEELRQGLETLSGAAAYTEDVVALAVGAAETALRSGFGGYSISTTCLRTSRQPGFELNAVLPMCGAATSGRLSVSGSRRHIQRLRNTLLPDAAPAADNELEDVVAEVSNQIAGMLKREFADRGVSFDLGIPWTYIGTDCPVRFPTRTASVLMTFESADASDPLLVDLVFDVFSAELDAPSTESGMEFGELAFL